MLMNLYMHYTFDRWMQRQYPQCPFARYADDAVVHCQSQAEAEELLVAIAGRLKECKVLRLKRRAYSPSCSRCPHPREMTSRCPRAADVYQRWPSSSSGYLGRRGARPRLGVFRTNNCS
jgi:hypothetical protein